MSRLIDTTPVPVDSIDAGALPADEAAMLAAYRAMNHATREITLAFARTLAVPAARPRPALALVKSNLQQRGGAR